MVQPSPQRCGEEEDFWACCRSWWRSWEHCPHIPHLASACNLQALGFFSGFLSKEPSLQERHPQVLPPGTHLMNQLVGHLRPEPYPRLLHPHPSVSKLCQSSAGQGGQRQFFSLLSVLSGSREHKECIAWAMGVDDPSTAV